jgi:hypothetical protein
MVAGKSFCVQEKSTGLSFPNDIGMQWLETQERYEPLPLLVLLFTERKQRAGHDLPEGLPLA